jgi:hypothetical protein
MTAATVTPLPLTATLVAPDTKFVPVIVTVLITVPAAPLFGKI